MAAVKPSLSAAFLYRRSVDSVRRSAAATSRAPIETKQESCYLKFLRKTPSGFLSNACSETDLFTNLIRLCITDESLRQLLQVHGLVITSGSKSDRFTCNHLLLAYSKLNDVKSAAKLFDLMPKRNIMSYNILIGGLLHYEEIDRARKLFDEMTERNVATWNAMVTGITNLGLNEQGLRYFLSMRREGFKPDEFSLASALRSCAGLEDISSGKQIHAYALLTGLENDMCVGSSLAHVYMKCGYLEEGENAMKVLPQLNVVSCNTIIAGRAQNGDAEGALAHFALMKEAGLAPDEVTFVSAVSTCSDLGILAQGQQVHAQAIKAGADFDVPVRSSLVSMYSKCGCLDDASNIYKQSEGTDLVLFSAMIAAYGFHGHGKEALRLFDQMIEEGIEPSEVTFLSLLYACCHCGLKDEGKNILRLMSKKYEMQPTLKHYTCVVDLLGRCGHLEEAEALIKSMPVKADGVIWKTLLAACKTHKNHEMAERVAENVIRFDPDDSAGYVLLSNVRASSERWREVSELRSAMKERNVRKEPGISWVELKGQVHQFSTGDQSHDIESWLKEMTHRMKEYGYAPDTSTVYHDMDEEEKEFSLAHHSEKLAIAFAMLNSHENTTIRVMKNLRVCSDCHTAIKFMSKITNREIVVRDVSRFHHFSPDGKCSCGDYW